MAKHIDSVAASGIERVTKGEFYQKIRPGDLLFCSGRAAISKAIEGLTDSPWSHVLMCWTPGPWAQWLTLEATYQKGVHIGLLADYVDRYDGEIVLARRPVLTQAMIEAELARGISMLDWGYDWQQEVSVAARKLIHSLPLLQPDHDRYCSGLQFSDSLATPYPLRKPLASFPTPEDNWIDPTVEPVCAPLR